MAYIHPTLFRLLFAGAVCSFSVTAAAQPNPRPTATTPTPLPSANPPAVSEPPAEPPPATQPSPEVTPRAAAPSAAVPPRDPDKDETPKPSQPAAQDSAQQPDSGIPQDSAPRTTSTKMPARADSPQLTPEDRGVQKGPPPPLVGMTFHVFLDSVWVSDANYGIFSADERTSSVGLGVQYDLFRFSPDLLLALGVSYSAERSSEHDFLPEYLSESSLSADHLQLSATLRYFVAGWLAPQLRAFGGPSFVETELQTPSRSVTDQSTSPTFGAAGGFTVLTPQRSAGALAALQFGLNVEGGYAFRAPLQVSLGEELAIGDLSDGGRRSELQGAELGEVERSGPFLRVAGLLRF